MNVSFFFPGEFIVSEEILQASHFEKYLMSQAVPRATPVSLATLETLLDRSTLLGTVQGTEMVPVYF